MSSTLQLGVFLLLSAALTAQMPNPAQQNDLILNNGVEGMYIPFSDPSVGAPPGGLSMPPALSGDYFWKVFPKEALNMGLSASGMPGRMEISGIEFFLADSDFSTSSGPNGSFWDLVLAPGMPSATAPGNIGPDVSHSEAVQVSLGDHNLQPPAVGCGAGVAGYKISVIIDMTPTTPFAPGDGIQIVADGTQDYTVTAFAPGGMSGTGGPCGLGDYTSIAAYSSDQFLVGVPEKQIHWDPQAPLAYSAYGGRHLGSGLLCSGNVPCPDLITEAAFLTLEFVEPILTPTVDLQDGDGPDRGLVTLHVPTSLGPPLLDFESYDYAAVSGGVAPGVAFVSGTVAPLTAPGFGGLGLLIDISTDPLHLFIANTLGFPWFGSYVFQPGPIFGNGVMTTSASFPIPSATATVSFQAAVSVAGTISFTNAFTVELLP